MIRGYVLGLQTFDCYERHFSGDFSCPGERSTNFKPFYYAGLSEPTWCRKGSNMSLALLTAMTQEVRM